MELLLALPTDLRAWETDDLMPRQHPNQHGESGWKQRRATASVVRSVVSSTAHNLQEGNRRVAARLQGYRDKLSDEESEAVHRTRRAFADGLSAGRRIGRYTRLHC